MQYRITKNGLNEFFVEFSEDGENWVRNLRYPSLKEAQYKMERYKQEKQERDRRQVLVDQTEVVDGPHEY